MGANPELWHGSGGMFQCLCLAPEWHMMWSVSLEQIDVWVATNILVSNLILQFITSLNFTVLHSFLIGRLDSLCSRLRKYVSFKINCFLFCFALFTFYNTAIFFFLFIRLSIDVFVCFVLIQFWKCNKSLLNKLNQEENVCQVFYCKKSPW